MKNTTTPKNSVLFKDLKLGAIFNCYGNRYVKIVKNEYGLNGKIEYSDYLALDLKTFEIDYLSSNYICYPIDTLVGKYNQF